MANSMWSLRGLLIRTHHTVMWQILLMSRPSNKQSDWPIVSFLSTSFGNACSTCCAVMRMQRGSIWYPICQVQLNIRVSVRLLQGEWVSLGLEVSDCMDFYISWFFSDTPSVNDRYGTPMDRPIDIHGAIYQKNISRSGINTNTYDLVRLELGLDQRDILTMTGVPMISMCWYDN